MSGLHCSRCGTSVAGIGPLVAAYLELPNGAIVCGSDCEPARDLPRAEIQPDGTYRAWTGPLFPPIVPREAA